MGLAGRKEKQRIPKDPRNLAWSESKLSTYFRANTFDLVLSPCLIHVSLIGDYLDP